MSFDEVMTAAIGKRHSPVVSMSQCSRQHIQVLVYRKKPESNRFDMVLDMRFPKGTTVGRIVMDVATACQATVADVLVRDLDHPALDPRGGIFRCHLMETFVVFSSHLFWPWPLPAVHYHRLPQTAIDSNGRQ